MSKILILTSRENSSLSENLQRDFLNFLNEKKPIIIDTINKYDELVFFLKKNPNTLLLYCNANIPKIIFRKLEQEIEVTKELLEKQCCSIGSIRFSKNKKKIKKIEITFTEEGKIRKKIFPRKKRNECYRRVS